MEVERRRVLVVGGSGYLGQHLLAALARSDGGGERTYDLAFTHHRPIPPQALVDAISPALHFQVDLQTGHGLASISEKFGQPDVVVNCAAMSVPRACEADPEAAMATNTPSSLLECLSSFNSGRDYLLIHLSTDQVYEGVKSYYKEDDQTVPVNMYGKSKVAAEQLISETCSNFAILRSSIIYGPQTISPVAKSLPIQIGILVTFPAGILDRTAPDWALRSTDQSLVNSVLLYNSLTGEFESTQLTGTPVNSLLWIDSVLSQGQEVEFFNDEFRCPVNVKDVVNTILALTKRWISGVEQMQLLLNVGGPDRLSRVQMAEAVADFRGYDHSLIKAVPASSVNRGVVSPADISMDIGRLIQVLGITPTSFKDGVRSTLEIHGS